MICEELLEEQRDISAPIQPQLQVGDCLIRDERLWHAGKGHNSGVNRPMIALIYSCPWRQWEGLQLEKSAEKLLVHEHLTQNAHFFSGDHDYLFCNSSYIEK